jgi:hypothetical protein
VVFIESTNTTYCENCSVNSGHIPQGADPYPTSSTRGKAGRNHLNEEITSLILTGKGEGYSQIQDISNLGHAALSRRCELPL